MGGAVVDTHGIDTTSYERRWVILGVLCMSLVLVVAAVSSINVAIPSIRAQLHPTDTQLLWIVDIYAVVFAGLLLPAGCDRRQVRSQGRAAGRPVDLRHRRRAVQPGRQPERAC